MTDQDLAKRLDELLSKEAIRDCIYRVERANDRHDKELMRSAYHPDAKIQWGTPEPVSLEAFLAGSEKTKVMTRQAQHLVGNILIDLQGDTANVEAYELSRHLTDMGGEWKDLVYSARYLDKFSRRNGEWKIETRIKIMDWMRVMEGADGMYDHVPLKGVRGPDDLSYQMFGGAAFTR